MNAVIPRPSSVRSSAIPIDFIGRRFISARSEYPGLRVLDKVIYDRRLLFEDAWDCNELLYYFDRVVDDFTEAGWTFTTTNSEPVLMIDIAFALKSNFHGLFVLRDQSKIMSAVVTDIDKLREILIGQDGILKEQFTRENIGYHSTGLCPPSSYWRKDKTSKSGLIVPERSLPPPFRNAHRHLRKRKGEMNKDVYFLVSDIEENINCLNTLKFVCEHNRYRREPFAHFYVCELDYNAVPFKQLGRSCAVKGGKQSFVFLKGFWNSYSPVPILKIWRFTCGPRGLFSEPKARVCLIHDNYDIVTRNYTHWYTIHESGYY